MIIAAFAGLIIISNQAFGQTAGFTLGSNDIHLSDGHVKLTWEGSDDGIFEVHRSQDESFAPATTVYQGPDRARFISGLENGTYYYRIRQESGDWSDTLTVTVRHQSLRLAMTLFGLGAVVFVLTVFVVVRGARRSADSTH